MCKYTTTYIYIELYVSTDFYHNNPKIRRCGKIKANFSLEYIFRRASKKQSQDKSQIFDVRFDSYQEIKIMGSYFYYTRERSIQMRHYMGNDRVNGLIQIIYYYLLFKTNTSSQFVPIPQNLLLSIQIDTRIDRQTDRQTGGSKNDSGSIRRMNACFVLTPFAC